VSLCDKNEVLFEISKLDYYIHCMQHVNFIAALKNITGLLSEAITCIFCLLLLSGFTFMFYHHFT
jgi:hypothetical protein